MTANLLFMAIIYVLRMSKTSDQLSLMPVSEMKPGLPWFENQ